MFYGLSEVSKPNIEFKWHLRLVNVWYVNTESMCSMYSVIIFQKRYSFQGDYTDFTLLGLPASAKVASAKVKV